MISRRERRWLLTGVFGGAVVAATVALVTVLVMGGGSETTDGPSASAPPPTTVPADPPSPAGDGSGPAPGGASDASEASPLPVAPIAGAFVETFDGAPDAPTPWEPESWDVTIHSRDVSTFDRLEPMSAAHGPDCAGPPATHETSAYEASVFLCRDHVMTAINAGGYAMIYLTPDEMVDFSEGEAVIRFDVSTLRTSIRDWWDVWITPYDDNLQLPLDLGSDVDVSGPPRNAVHVTLGTENQIKADIQQDFETVTFPDWPEGVVTGDTFTGYETFLQPDAARRDTIEIAISRNHLRVGMPQYDFWWIDTDIPELAWDRGVVQLGHHSYNPSKDCNIDNTPRPPVDECTANTWHWDNLTISDAVPFTIIPSDARQAHDGASTLEFAEPAPAEAHLRFTAIGEHVEVQFGDGAWTDAVPQATVRETVDEHFTSYWMPIPAGTQSVSFRADDWWGGPWVARDATVWSASS